MQNKTWIWAGCGGCLVLCLIFILVAGGFIFTLWRSIEGFQEDIQVMEEKQRQLQSKYPFPGAENYQLEPQRFQQFLQARQESVHVADQHLVWLNNLTTPPAEGETRRDPSVFEIIRNLFSIIQGFFKVGVVITEQLEIQQMSVEEYTHLTTITAAEVYSGWSWKRRSTAAI